MRSGGALILRDAACGGPQDEGLGGPEHERSFLDKAEILIAERRRSLRQFREQIVFTADPSFLLGTGPAFDLSLIGDRVRNAIEVHGIDKAHGAAFGRVTSEKSKVMLADAGLQIMLAACADVLAPVSAKQNVEPAALHVLNLPSRSSHLILRSREAASRRRVQSARKRPQRKTPPSRMRGWGRISQARASDVNSNSRPTLQVLVSSHLSTQNRFPLLRSML